MFVGNWSLKGLIHKDDLLSIAEDGREKVPNAEKDLVDLDLPMDFDHIHLAPVKRQFNGKGRAVVDDDEGLEELEEDDNNEEEEDDKEEETDEDAVEEVSMEVEELSGEEV
ncbi:hypothetical protein PM082_004457 [Marasmius tenuissimus]|nr:hypothetical protein PM082_004457 [Marasmius tenuissimus]